MFHERNDKIYELKKTIILLDYGQIELMLMIVQLINFLMIKYILILEKFEVGGIGLNQNE